MLRSLVASYLLLSSTLLFAELKELNDDDLSEVKGQAGVTIDIEYQLYIGEIAWMDGGSLVAQGIRIGGNNNEAKRLQNR